MNTFKLLHNKILKPEEILPFKDYFFELLQSKKDNVDNTLWFLYNTLWFFIDGLIESKILTLEESIFFYDKGLEIDPKNTDALNRKGIVYYDLKQYVEALKNFDKVLKIDPNYVYALKYKAFMYADRTEC